MKYSNAEVGMPVYAKYKGAVFNGEITRLIPNSRTKILVRDTERGPGWKDRTSTYNGCKIKSGWYLGRNYCFGYEYELHVKDVELLKTE